MKPTVEIRKLLEDLRSEADLCRSEHADDVAGLLDRAADALTSLSHTTFHFEICRIHNAQGARFDGKMPCCIAAERDKLKSETAKLLRICKDIDRSVEDAPGDFNGYHWLFNQLHAQIEHVANTAAPQGE